MQAGCMQAGCEHVVGAASAGHDSSNGSQGSGLTCRLPASHSSITITTAARSCAGVTGTSGSSGSMPIPLAELPAACVHGPWESCPMPAAEAAVWSPPATLPVSAPSAGDMSQQLPGHMSRILLLPAAGGADSEGGAAVAASAWCSRVKEPPADADAAEAVVSMDGCWLLDMLLLLLVLVAVVEVVQRMAARSCQPGLAGATSHGWQLGAIAAHSVVTCGGSCTALPLQLVVLLGAWDMPGLTQAPLSLSLPGVCLHAAHLCVMHQPLYPMCSHKPRPST
jgi:hypothetical protein